MSLFLIGLRGVGKSTSGRLAAQALEVPFIDTDIAIEEQVGQCLRHFFQQEGEPAFRALERDLLLSLLGQRDPIVVATGGGCILDSEVREGLRHSGRALWLTAPLPLLKQRIKGSNRPSLTGGDIEEELATLLHLREPFYHYCAAASIATDSLSPSEVAHVIQHFWSILPHNDLR